MPPPSDKVIIGPYVARGPVGEGGWADVFVAEQADGVKVAIKVLKSEISSDKAAFQRFTSLEGTIALHLEALRQKAQDDGNVEKIREYRHVVRYLSSGVWGRRPYIVTEYVEGGSVRELLKRQSDGRIGVREACRIVAGAARGAACLHSAGAHRGVHRDISPGNILLDVEGVSKLTDFGVWKLLPTRIDGSTQRAIPRLTSTGVSLGTPIYAAPEVLSASDDRIDFWSDVYSLGAVLFELLTGKPHRTVNNSLSLFPVTPVPIPNPIRQGLDSDLDGVCRKCLADGPTARFQTAIELAEVLTRIIEKLPPDPSPSQKFASPPLLPTPPAPPNKPVKRPIRHPVPPPRGTKWATLRTGFLAFGVMAAIGIIISVIVLKYNPQQKTQKTDSSRTSSSSTGKEVPTFANEKAKAKFEKLVQALKEAPLKVDDKPVPVPDELLQVIAATDSSEITKDQLKRYAKPVEPTTSGLKYRTNMGTSTGFYKRAGGYALFLSHRTESGVVLDVEDASKPEYVIFFPDDGRSPLLLFPRSKRERGGVLDSSSPGIYAVPLE